MKRFAFALLLGVLLSGCTASTVTYKLDFNMPDQGLRNDLTLKSLKVIERRLERVGEVMEDQQVRTGEGDTRLVITLANSDVAEMLTQELTEPFKMAIMKQVEEGKGTHEVAGHGSFDPTGITQEHLVWAEAAEDEGGKGSVRLVFTEEGRALMNTVFSENQGKYIGLFVRDRLVSKLLVESGKIKDEIIIHDIPSPEIAHVFADDLNVGLHVTFTPVP